MKRKSHVLIVGVVFFLCATSECQSGEEAVGAVAERVVFDLHRNLATIDQKKQFVDQVNSFMGSRMVAKPQGYESTSDFKAGFAVLFAAVEKRLEKELRPLSKQEVEMIKGPILLAYPKNKVAFKKFNKDVLKEVPLFQQVKEEDVLKLMAQFSGVIYEVDSKMWSFANGGSYVWPACLRTKKDK